MKRLDPNIDTFDEGRKHALAAVRDSMARGGWNPQKRADLLRLAVHLRQIHRCQTQQRAYYAGLISVLKSGLSAKFSCDPLSVGEYATGWDWDGDEDNFGSAW